MFVADFLARLEGIPENVYGPNNETIEIIGLQNKSDTRATEPSHGLQLNRVPL